MKTNNTIYAKVTMKEHERLREYAQGFALPMGELMRQLLLWAVENVPTESTTVRTLNINGNVIREEAKPRTLRGRTPKKV